MNFTSQRPNPQRTRIEVELDQFYSCKDHLEKLL